MDSRDGFYGPVNIGNPNEFSMIELANAVLELTQSQSKLVFLPLPQDDPKQRQPDISLAQSELKWNPSIELKEGLTKTIAYFRGLL